MYVMGYLMSTLDFVEFSSPHHCYVKSFYFALSSLFPHELGCNTTNTATVAFTSLVRTKSVRMHISIISMALAHKAFLRR